MLYFLRRFDDVDVSSCVEPLEQMNSHPVGDLSHRVHMSLSMKKDRDRKLMKKMISRRNP